MPKAQTFFIEDFPPDEFRAWQKNAGLTNIQIARIFKVRPQTVGRWRDRGAPMLVRWACYAWGTGYRPSYVEEAVNPPRRRRSAKPPGNPQFQR